MNPFRSPAPTRPFLHSQHAVLLFAAGRQVQTRSGLPTALVGQRLSLVTGNYSQRYETATDFYYSRIGFWAVERSRAGSKKLART